MSIKQFFKSKEITNFHLRVLQFMVILQVIVGILLITLELLTLKK
jgi:hypothetical protein